MTRETNRLRTLIFVLLIVFMVSLTFFIMGQIYEGVLPKVVEEFNNSVIGAILTAIITMMLLVQQSQSDEVREKKSKVFEEKLAIYNNFLDTVRRVTQDNRITVSEREDELKELIFELARIKMHSTAGNTQKTVDLLQNITELLQSEEERGAEFDYQTFSEVVFAMVDVFQEELYDRQLGRVGIDMTSLIQKVAFLEPAADIVFTDTESLRAFLDTSNTDQLRPFSTRVFFEVDAFVDSLATSVPIAKTITVNTEEATVENFTANYRLRQEGKETHLLAVEIWDTFVNIELNAGVEMLDPEMERYFDIESDYQFTDAVREAIATTYQFLTGTDVDGA